MMMKMNNLHRPQSCSFIHAFKLCGNLSDVETCNCFSDQRFLWFTCVLTGWPSSTLYFLGRVSTSRMSSMVTSLGSTANRDVTYMMMDFLSGSCTATSKESDAWETSSFGNLCPLYWDVKIMEKQGSWKHSAECVRAHVRLVCDSSRIGHVRCESVFSETIRDFYPQDRAASRCSAHLWQSWRRVQVSGPEKEPQSDPNGTREAWRQKEMEMRWDESRYIRKSREEEKRLETRFEKRRERRQGKKRRDVKRGDD